MVKKVSGGFSAKRSSGLIFLSLDGSMPAGKRKLSSTATRFLVPGPKLACVEVTPAAWTNWGSKSFFSSASPEIST